MSTDEQLTPTPLKTSPVSDSGASSKPKHSRTTMRIAVIVVVVAIVTALVVYAVRTDVPDRMGAYFAAQKQVAMVNGTVVRQGELVKVLEQIAPGQIDTLDESTRAQVLDDLIDVKLLLHEARAKGYTVTDESVQEEFDALVSQVGGEEAFETQIAIANISEREIREDIADELLLKQLVEAETEIDTVVVTDEEVQQSYDEAVTLAQSSGSAGDIPPLDEVREAIQNQLIQQKQQEIIIGYVDELRANADIKITL
jgi:hypothetical protein